MARAIKKAGIGAIIPQKLIHKKGKKNFDKGKKMLGPLMGMMKEGGEIPKMPELPRTYLAYKRQAKKNMGSKTGTDLYKNIMLTKDEFKYYKNLQKLENKAKKKGKVISTADIVKGAEGAVIGENKNKVQKFFTGAELQMLMPLIQGAAGGQGGGEAGSALSGLMGGGKPGGGEEPKKKKKKITVPRIKGFGAI